MGPWSIGELLRTISECFLNDVAMNIGQAEVKPAIAIREAFMVQSEILISAEDSKTAGGPISALTPDPLSPSGAREITHKTCVLQPLLRTNICE